MRGVSPSPPGACRAGAAGVPVGAACPGVGSVPGPAGSWSASAVRFDACGRSDEVTAADRFSSSAEMSSPACPAGSAPFGLATLLAAKVSAGVEAFRPSMVDLRRAGAARSARDGSVEGWACTAAPVPTRPALRLRAPRNTVCEFGHNGVARRCLRPGTQRGRSTAAVRETAARVFSRSGTSAALQPRSTGALSRRRTPPRLRVPLWNTSSRPSGARRVPLAR